MIDLILNTAVIVITAIFTILVIFAILALLRKRENVRLIVISARARLPKARKQAMEDREIRNFQREISRFDHEGE